jgi:hypothetical protein
LYYIQDLLDTSPKMSSHFFDARRKNIVYPQSAFVMAKRCVAVNRQASKCGICFCRRIPHRLH